MPTLILRRHVTVPAYPNCFQVILPMDDGYELRVGQISEETGANMSRFWAWCCPGANGRAPSREDAMTALRAAWNVSDAELQALRRQQERTASKYSLFDAGYRDQIARGVIHCPCGATFNPRSHEETMAHIEHIKAGTKPHHRA
jgi:hypothetical protein